MCLAEIAKMPKLQTACTTFISEGMVVTTESDTVKQARKTMLEFVLQNHPLDCPVCDAGGQCELQDATLSYGPGESRLIDPKNHKDEQQWSPIVYFDRPRCIMCYRCVRVCGEGMDVWALGIANRNSAQLIVPNKAMYRALSNPFLEASRIWSRFRPGSWGNCASHFSRNSLVQIP